MNQLYAVQADKWAYIYIYMIILRYSSIIYVQHKIDLCLKYFDRFRQYGLWDRYTDLYPDQDLVYTVESSIYQTDWYFAHVNR